MLMMGKMALLAVGGETVVPMSFIASETGRGTGTATINKPAGTQAGDIMVAFMGGMFTGVTMSSAPSGWTLLASNGGNPPFLYYKIAGGSEPSSYSWTISSGNIAGAILTYLSAEDGEVGSVSLNSTAPSVTAAALGTLLAFYMNTTTSSVSAPPAGMTERAFIGGAAPSIAVYDEENVGAGATGTRALTWNPTGNHRSVLYHIEQA